MRPLKAYINLSALTFNLQLVKKIAKNSKVMAVLKANAYGHGLEESVKAIKSADGIAILTIDEAIKIRKAGFENTILLLEGLFTGEDIYEAEKLNLNLVLHNDLQIEYLNQATLKTPINVHLKINTGMNRLGFPPDQVDYLIENLRLKIRVIAISNSRKMLLNDESISLKDWKSQLDKSDIKADRDAFFEHAKKLNLRTVSYTHLTLPTKRIV